MDEIEKNPIRLKSIFIDWSNVFIYANNNLGIRIDPVKLCDFVSNNENVVQRHYFSAEDPNNSGQKNFHEGLKKKGFFVHVHELKETPGKVYCPGCNVEINCICQECGTPTIIPRHKSKRIDILIAQKLLQTSDLYDEAILISGDQDFIPIIDYLRSEKGKKVTVVSFKDSLSYDYLKSNDEILYLDEHIDEIMQKR